MGPFLHKIKEVFSSRVLHKVSNFISLRDLSLIIITSLQNFTIKENYIRLQRVTVIKSAALFSFPMQVSLHPAAGQLLNINRNIGQDVQFKK